MTKEKANILVIDVGGTNIKIVDSHHAEPVKIPSGPLMTAGRMVEEVRNVADNWKYTAVSVGYPGPVVAGKPAAEPRNLGPGWTECDFAKVFGVPVRMLNDAAMQALGSYKEGRMLFLGFGTGLGSALVAQGTVVPLELAHLPYRKGRTFEDYVGVHGLARLGKKRWREHVAIVIGHLRDALVAEYVVLGGGNSKLLKDLPPGVHLGSNANAFTGGFRLWQDRPYTGPAAGSA